MKKFKITLPDSNGNQTEIESNQSIIFIGANGSGKTRLGVWIDLKSPQNEKAHRISAQKILTMPDTATPVAINLAESDLLYGSKNMDTSGLLWHKEYRRWGSGNKSAAVSSLNDFEKLMVYLFSEHTEQAAKYLDDSIKSQTKITPPITKLALVKNTWEKILPHRELIISGLRIQTCVKGSKDSVYSSSEMSDGERVIFYLIGQCLAAPNDGIIIVDEPEIHLHKSIQAPLWREIENLRNDCLFIYLTHDVDFAISLRESKKIWLKGFDGINWDWQTVPQMEDLPEDLLIQILGSRKPVVFVEGENGSYDSSLYSSILSDYLVVPCGSCSQVIQIVKSLNTNQKIHRLTVLGIIDRDRRNDIEIKSLEHLGIYTLNVAEVENLFCVPEVIRVVSKQLLREEDDDVISVKKFVIKSIRDEIESQISLRAINEIKFRLNCFNEKAKGKGGIADELKRLTSSINIDEIYSENESLFSSAVANNDYELILRIYNRKSLSTQISKHLGLSNGELAELVVRIANSSNGSVIKEALKPYFGNFSDKI
jgi:ABC-type lipoprotein export system ATPase subunit